jgi:hypothetical protein
MASFADMNQVIAAMNALPVGEDGAQAMVNQGLVALDKADANAGTGGGVLSWFGGGSAAAQPGEQGKRDNIRAHLGYYNENPDQLESGFNDIRNWTQQAFVAYNAVVAANQTLQFAASQFWADALTAFHNVLAAVGTVAGSIVSGAGDVAGETAGGLLSGIFSGLLSNPAGLLLLAGVGYLAYSAYKKVR